MSTAVEIPPLVPRRQLFFAAIQLVRAYGQARLLLTLALTLAQAVAQVVGVASIFWFISVAVAPEAFRENSTIAWGLNMLGAETISSQSLTFACGLCSLAVLLISNLLSLSGEYARARYAHGMGCWLRDVLLRRILNQPYEYFLNTNSSVLVKKIVQDVMQFVQHMVLPALEILTRVLIFAMLSSWLVVHEPVVAIGGLALFALFEMCFIRIIRSRAALVSNGFKSGGKQIYSAVGQIFSGIRPVITENSREYFAESHHRPSLEVARLLPQATLIGSLGRYTIETVVYGGLVSWLLLELLSGNSIQQLMPSVGLFSVAAYRMLPCIQITAGQLTIIQSSAHSLQEILDEFELPLDCSRMTFEHCEHVSPLPFHEELELANISFRYQATEDAALKDLSISVRRGERIGIVGATGSGKSTLVNLILGLFSPTSGSVLIDGQLLDQTNLSEWRAAIGYVPQDPFLIDATIAENIAFGIRRDAIDDELAMSVAEIAQISDYIEKECEDGLDTVIGERGARLSGGQKQRIAIARALYKRPQLLILDEATSALDNITEKMVTRRLSDLKPDLTVISIAHRLSTIENCDCIYYLSDGRLRSSGSYPELMRNSAQFKQLVDAG